MSGESNVEESTVAAPANATAPTLNDSPVVQRRAILTGSDVMALP